MLENPHELLLETPPAAEFTVVSLNPDVLVHSRSPARKEDKLGDVRGCCLLALNRHAAPKTLMPREELTGQLRAIAHNERRVLSPVRPRCMDNFPDAVQRDVVRGPSDAVFTDSSRLQCVLNGQDLTRIWAHRMRLRAVDGAVRRDVRLGPASGV